MKLFVIYIGGSHAKSLIELHDIRFVLADKIEDTYDVLRESWWGTPSSLHLDAWGALEQVDGFSIHISDQPQNDLSKKLFFVNLGGYDDKQFTELHKNTFVIAANEAEAKQKAVAQVRDWQVPHKDYLYQVESILDVNNVVNQQNYYIHLHEDNKHKPFEFTTLYTPIGK